MMKLFGDLEVSMRFHVTLQQELHYEKFDSIFSKATKIPNMVGKLDHFLILSDKSL